MTTMQGEDGIPHFAYYDTGRQLSFIWNGLSPHIQVCPGGYGEDPMFTIYLPVNTGSIKNTPVGWLAYFKQACLRFIEEKGDELL